MKRRASIFLSMFLSMMGLIMLAGVALPGFAVAAEPQPKSLIIATPAEGTTAHIWTVAIANVLRKYMGVAITVSPTSGAFEASNLLLKGDAQGAYGDVVATYNSYMGLPGYDRGTHLVRQLQGGYTGVYHVVVRADSNIKTIADLKGKRFMCFRPGTPLIEEVWPVLLAAYKLTRKDLKVLPAMSPKEQTAALKEGRTDAFFLIGGIPNPALTELSYNVPIRLLGITKGEEKEIINKIPYFYTITAPANSYKGQNEPVPVLAYPSGIVLKKDLPNEFVYTMAKTMVEHLEEIQGVHNSLKDLTRQSIATGLYIPLHAGAFKYYKEKGLIPANMERFHKDLLAKMKQTE